jgi:hypothetical protein
MIIWDYIKCKKLISIVFDIKEVSQENFEFIFLNSELQEESNRIYLLTSLFFYIFDFQDIGENQIVMKEVFRI